MDLRIADRVELIDVGLIGIVLNHRHALGTLEGTILPVSVTHLNVEIVDSFQLASDGFACWLGDNHRRFRAARAGKAKTSTAPRRRK